LALVLKAKIPVLGIGLGLAVQVPGLGRECLISYYIYFRLPERPQKPIELATIKQHKENCKNQKIQKK